MKNVINSLTNIVKKVSEGSFKNYELIKAQQSVIKDLIDTIGLLEVRIKQLETNSK